LLGARQAGANGAEQVSLVHGLGEVIVGTEIHAVAHVGLLAFGSEEDERDVHRGRVVVQFLEHAVAVQLRHHHVAQD
jgi:hypothetical protein